MMEKKCAVKCLGIVLPNPTKVSKFMITRRDKVRMWDFPATWLSLKAHNRASELGIATNSLNWCRCRGISRAADLVYKSNSLIYFACISAEWKELILKMRNSVYFVFSIVIFVVVIINQASDASPVPIFFPKLSRFINDLAYGGNYYPQYYGKLLLGYFSKLSSKFQKMFPNIFPILFFFQNSLIWLMQIFCKKININ